jgi:CoA:oxalate CoA-transferase
MDRLGVGAEELHKVNPRLVYGSSSGYGKEGPYRDYPAMDLVMQAMCGVIDSTGYPDQPGVKSGAALCDFMAGIHLYAAIMTALYERSQTGKGRVVEVSMQDATYASLASNLGMLRARGEAAPSRTGNRHGGLGVAPYNVYPTIDGHVVLNAPGDHHFRAILDVMDRGDVKDDPRFMTRTSRVLNCEAVDALIESWTKDRKRDDVARLMLAAKVPCAPVRELSEVMVDENMHTRGSLQWVDHPELGRVVLMHSPLVFEGTPRRPIEPSLPLGSRNGAMYGEWLGQSAEELAALRAGGVIS